jgi:hypothetical protein
MQAVLQSVNNFAVRFDDLVPRGSSWQSAQQDNGNRTYENTRLRGSYL